jgi:hypothetical protein
LKVISFGLAVVPQGHRIAVIFKSFYFCLGDDDEDEVCYDYEDSIFSERALECREGGGGQRPRKSCLVCFFSAAAAASIFAAAVDADVVNAADTDVPS